MREKKTVKFGGGRVMVSGIHVAGVGTLVRNQGPVNAVVYKLILSHHAIPCLQISVGSIFM